MKISEVLRGVQEAQGVTITQISNRLGKGRSAISERFRQDNISIDKLNEILRVLDYKIVIMPADTRLPKDSYEVE